MNLLTALIRPCAIALLLAAGTARAGLGLTELPGATAGDGPVTVFYPSAAQPAVLHRGPFTLEAAWQGAPAQGNGRLVVISHGSGGNAWVHSMLARALVDAGFTVALPLHHRDNAFDPSQPGPESWKLRPVEVSHAIDAVARDPALSPLLRLDRVGMYGMSAGGHTALTLAGGRWSPSQFMRHCQAHIAEDFPACVGLITRLTGGMLDGLKKSVALGVIGYRFDDPHWYSHTDRRIAAVVAGVPFGADFDMGSLATPAVPLGLVVARQDKWLAPRWHSQPILDLCKTCEVLADLPQAGHGALLSPPPPAELLGGTAAELLLDPPGFDRAAMAQVDARIAAFMRRHLLP